MKAGEILYREGDPNDCAYVLASGEILLFSEADGHQVDCERRGAGSILGETSILTNQPRAVSVRAETDCRFFRISSESILQQFDELDPILRSCIETTIKFVTRFNATENSLGIDVPFAPSTLRNANELIQKFDFELDINKGIKNNEFSLMYQPIVHLETAGIVGFEALMRWQHPSMGFVPPDRFISVAEAMGSISQLTDYALLEACAALRRLCDATGRTLFASVNVSGHDIGRKGFVDFLDHVLDLHNITAKQLKLEVTETALVPDSDHATENLERLHQLGCGVSIDDFGTGYSNLAYLKSLPLTALKIDRAFAGDAHANSVSYAIVRMLIALGRELGVDVIAEGLETAEDVRILRALNCKFAQGFFFHKPMAEAELEHLLIDPSAVSRVVA